MRRLLSLSVLGLAFPAAAGEICLDKEAVWRARQPGVLFAWEHHIYVDHQETGTWSHLRPSQVRDVLVEGDWAALNNRELLRLSELIVGEGGQIKARDQGCGVVISVRALNRPPAGDVVWDLVVASRGTPLASGKCEADCFGH